MRKEPSRFLCLPISRDQVSDIMIRSSRMQNIIREDGTIQVSLSSSAEADTQVSDVMIQILTNT